MLDVSPHSPVADFFVIGTGTSARQMRSVCDDIAELGRERNYPARSTSGYEGQNWMLLDCIDVVVHLFSKEARSFYDLESLWGDAKKIEWKE